ncbi:hypothetical protein LRY65_05510 [Candidatus Woesebacteria bacterium]|nr:hypothetical protein [Candidatus Woesebacteria bacterium]MCD8506718.1 hypothetical protein [Candidatus Woesebacteria bacterium]MCD8527626.1 hypothetical protein [Candidatus Woesebacteria bacterium]MCD8546403.1 hypothetical protein [Candidatus Woesebacteria bacterium]
MALLDSKHYDQEMARFTDTVISKIPEEHWDEEEYQTLVQSLQSGNTEITGNPDGMLQILQKRQETSQNIQNILKVKEKEKEALQRLQLDIAAVNNFLFDLMTCKSKSEFDEKYPAGSENMAELAARMQGARDFINTLISNDIFPEMDLGDPQVQIRQVLANSTALSPYKDIIESQIFNNT